MAQDVLATIPPERIYSSERIAGTGDPPRYDVVLVMTRNEGASDLAQQLLTTVGTLVVAVAGFYFGSSSAASDVVRKFAGVEPPSTEDPGEEIDEADDEPDSSTATDSESPDEETTGGKSGQ